MNIRPYDDWICADDDWTCIDDDWALADADDAVCDDNDGLLPHEAEEYEKEKRYLDLFRDILYFPLEYGLSYEMRNKYIRVVGYC